MYFCHCLGKVRRHDNLSMKISDLSRNSAYKRGIVAVLYKSRWISLYLDAFRLFPRRNSQIFDTQLPRICLFYCRTFHVICTQPFLFKDLHFWPIFLFSTFLRRCVSSANSRKFKVSVISNIILFFLNLCFILFFIFILLLIFYPIPHAYINPPIFSTENCHER